MSYTSSSVIDEFPFSEEFQHAILKVMIKDDIFMAQAVKYLKEEYFNNQYLSWVFRTLKKFWDSYGHGPNYAEIKNEIMKHKPEKRTPYFNIIEQVMNVNEQQVNESYMRKELTGFVRRSIFVRAYKQVANIYNQRRTEDAHKFMQDKIMELMQVDFEQDNVVDFDRIYDYIEKIKEEASLAIPTGIEPIDAAMNGGITPGSLTVIISGTNAGKSMALVNMAYYAVINKKKVVYIVHEDRESDTVLRFIARFTKIPYNKLQCASIGLSEQEKQKVNLARKIMKKYLIVKFMYGAETTVEDVRDWLMLKMKEEPFDMVIDDYGQFIRTRIKTDGERFTQAVVYRTLKQISLELKIPMVTCAQGNRESQKMSKKGVDWIRGTDIAECFEITRVASNVISLNRSEEQAKQNELVYYLDKQKSGPIGIAVQCQTDYSRCITHEEGKMWILQNINLLREKIDIREG